MLLAVSAFSQGSEWSLKPGSVTFTAGSFLISASIQRELATLRDKMRANPDFKVVIAGRAGGSKHEQQLSWDRVNAVIAYMSDVNDIDRSRFIFRFEDAISANRVNYRGPKRGEEGPSQVPRPHPDLRP